MIIYSRTALAQDSDGNLTRLKTLQPNEQLSVNDEESLDILYKILEELKKNNIYNAITHDVMI